MSSRPNIRPIKPNFNIKPSDQLPQSIEPQPHVEKQPMKLAMKPFERPSSSRKEDIRASQQFEESQADEQPKQAIRRTPVNGFRKFNMQNPAPPQSQNIEESILQQYMNGPAINLKANKEVIEKQAQEIQQQEMREKLQVNIKSKPMGFQEIFQDTAKSVQSVQKSQTRSKMNLKPTKDVKPVEPVLNIEEVNMEQPRPKRKLKEQPQQQSTLQQIAQQTTTQESIQQPESQPSKTQPIKVTQPVEDYQPKEVKQLNTKSVVQVSQNRIEIQKQRLSELSQMITLEVDEYANQISLQPRSQYDIYINQIKGNIIKNSQDQAFDDKVTQELQTDEIELVEFSNQCPEDYHRTFLQTTNKSQTNRLAEFLEYSMEVIEEILNIGSIQNNDDNNFYTQTLHIPRDIQDQLQCTPIKIGGHCQYKNELNLLQCCYVQDRNIKWLNGTIVICQPSGTILFTPSLLTTISGNGHYIVGGTSDGQLVGWNLNDKESHTNKYTDKFMEIHNIAIQFIHFSSEWNSAILDQFAETTQHHAPIQCVQFNQQMTTAYEIISLDIFGQTLMWQVQELRYEESEKQFVEIGLKSRVKLQLVNQLAKQSNKLYHSLAISQEKILTCGPTKVVNIVNLQQYADDNLNIPTAISQIEQNYFYIGYSDGTLKAFHEQFPHSIWTIRASMTTIRYIFNLGYSKVVIIDKDNQLGILDLNQNEDEPVHSVNLSQGQMNGSYVIHAFMLMDSVNVLMGNKLIMNQVRTPLGMLVKQNTNRLEQLLSVYEGY